MPPAVSARKLDLYEFFSVLVPGVVFLVALFPFLPTSTPVGSATALVPLVALGFVVGRGLHSGGVKLARALDDETHRGRFVTELRDPDRLDEAVVSAFYGACRNRFDDLDLPEDRSGATDSQLASLYVLVRSFVHVDGRARSRTFQATYAFLRTAQFTVFLLFVVYFAYGLLELLSLLSGIQTYQSFVGAIDLPALFVVLGSWIALLASIVTLREATPEYRRVYVEYLISDFLVLCNSGDLMQGENVNRNDTITRKGNSD